MIFRITIKCDITCFQYISIEQTWAALRLTRDCLIMTYFTLSGPLFSSPSTPPDTPDHSQTPLSTIK